MLLCWAAFLLLTKLFGYYCSFLFSLNTWAADHTRTRSSSWHSAPKDLSTNGQFVISFFIGWIGTPSFTYAGCVTRGMFAGGGHQSAPLAYRINMEQSPAPRYGRGPWTMFIHDPIENRKMRPRCLVARYRRTADDELKVRQATSHLE